MRGALLTAALAGLPFAGCLDLSMSCREGPGDHLAIVEFHPGFGPPSTTTSRQSLSHDGLFFVYTAAETPGSGRITTHPNATAAYLPPERLRAELESIGHFDPALDYGVYVAWVGEATDEEFSRLCAVLDEEWVEPRPKGDERGVCLDGGSRTYHFAAERGTVTKRGGCVGEPRSTEQEWSERRIDEAYRALAKAVQERALRQGTDTNPYSRQE